MKKKLIFYINFIAFFSIFNTSISEKKEKILIFSQVYNRPDFIELHKKTFDAFLQDEFEYAVFNDAPDENMKFQIEETCNKIGVRCFRIPQNLHLLRPHTSAGHRHMDGIKYSFDTLGFDHDGIVVLIDSDMFLIRPLSINEYMKGYDLIGGYQERSNESVKVTYMAPTVVCINMKTCPNKRDISFEGGYIEGLSCDVGAHTFNYIKNNPSLKYRFFFALSATDITKDTEELKQMGFDEMAIKFITGPQQVKRYGFEFHGDKNFMHFYAGGSNWPGYSAEWVQEKNKLIYDFIDESINYHKNK